MKWYVIIINIVLKAKTNQDSGICECASPKTLNMVMTYILECEYYNIVVITKIDMLV